MAIDFKKNVQPFANKATALDEGINLVGNGYDLDAVNGRLKEIGEQVIDPTNPKTAGRLAEVQLNALKSDEAWGKKLMEGNFDANQQFDQLARAIVAGKKYGP